MQVGQTDFRIASGEDLVQPGTVAYQFDPAVDLSDLNFTPSTTPRFMTVEVSGTLKVTDWGNNTITRNVLQGQVIAHRPSKLWTVGSTATVTLEF